jgi:hypothetical protein
MYMDIRERVTLDGSAYRVTIAANEKARQPPELDFAGLSTDNYAKNPVVMWAHDTIGHSPSGGLPIGRTLKITKTPSGEVVADFEFLDDDPFARRVKNAWDRGFLRAASISWLPVETVPIPGGGWRDARSDLLEWSIVSVPADPEALRESHRMLIDEYLGGRGWLRSGSESGGSGVREKGNSIWRMASALSPDDYDDLSAALALIRDVMGGVESRSSACADAGDNAPDLREISSIIKSLKDTVIQPPCAKPDSSKLSMRWELR